MFHSVPGWFGCLEKEKKVKVSSKPLRSLKQGIALCLCLCCVSSVSAQQPKKKTLAGKVNLSKYRLNSGTPKSFVPFTLRNPNTQQMLDPQTMLKLPTGKSIRAGEALLELNRVEKELNKHGFSLRDKAQERLKLVEGFFQSPQYRKQIADSKRLILPGKFVERAPKAVVATIRKRAISPVQAAAIEERIRRLAAWEAAVRPIRRSDPFTWRQEWGDRDTFQVFISTVGNAEASYDNTSLSTDSRLGAYVFGVGGDIYRVTGASTYNRGGGHRSTIDGRSYLFGEEIGSIHDSRDGDTSASSGRIGPSFDEGVTVSFPIVGIITLDLKAGLRGSVYGEIEIGASPSVWSAHLVCAVGANVAGYAEVSLSLAVIRGGVGGDATIVDGRIEWTFEGGLTSTGPGDLSLRIAEIGTGRLELLSGRIYVFVDFFNPLPWVWEWERAATVDLWNGTGFRLEGDLRREEAVTRLPGL